MANAEDAQEAKLAINEIAWLLKAWRESHWWRRWAIGHSILVKLDYRFAEIARVVTKAERAERVEALKPQRIES